MYDCPLLSFFLWDRNCRNAEWYKIISSWTYRYDNTVRLCLKHIANGESILDVGCSLGIIAILLKLNLRESEVKCVDVGRAPVVDILPFFPEIKVDFEIDNVLSLRNRADWIICTEVLEHLEDDKAGLVRVYENCKKGVVLSVPNEKSRQGIEGHKRTYTKEAFGNLISQVTGNFELADDPMNRCHNFAIIKKLEAM